jgi:hypothetical protein
MSALCRFCCRNRHADGAGRLVPFLKPSVVAVALSVFGGLYYALLDFLLFG